MSPHRIAVGAHLRGCGDRIFAAVPSVANGPSRHFAAPHQFGRKRTSTTRRRCRDIKLGGAVGSRAVEGDLLAIWDSTRNSYRRWQYGLSAIAWRLNGRG